MTPPQASGRQAYLFLPFFAAFAAFAFGLTVGLLAGFFLPAVFFAPGFSGFGDFAAAFGAAAGAVLGAAAGLRAAAAGAAFAAAATLPAAAAGAATGAAFVPKAG
ncbi:MAG: hypothetical protein WCC04_19715, partial [Terriglobales bacterium]